MADSADAAPAGIRVAAASAADHEAVRGLLREAELPVEDLSPGAMSRFLAAREDGAVVGAVGVEPAGSAGLLRSLVVTPRLRGRGLGRALAGAAEARGRARGLDALYLLTTTAERFFARLGYRRVERADVPGAVRETEEFRRLCPDTAVCMRKTL